MLSLHRNKQRLCFIKIKLIFFISINVSVHEFLPPNFHNTLIMNRMRSSSIFVISSRELRKLLGRPVETVRRITDSRMMLHSEERANKIKEMKREMFHMYENAVSAVKPSKLISQIITKCDDTNFLINGRKYIFNKNVYVVGFGKAILDMALQVHKVLGDNIVKGILSVPDGTIQSPETNDIKKQNIQIREGAPGNLPDEKAESTARDIASLVESLGDNTILLVLISGGGSALLPAPLPGITVEDTAQLVFNLQSKGASIYEVNSVRKRLCTLKGGRLAIKAYPAQVISFILSDVIGDSLDFIASGPTVENTDSPLLPLQIIQKYELQKDIKENILQALQRIVEPPSFPHGNVFNVLIGSNRTALESTQEYAVKAKYFPLIISDKIDIPVEELSKWYSSLCITFFNAVRSRKFEHLKLFLEAAVERYNFSSNIVKTLLEYAPKFGEADNKGLCIIGGGEPTVTVKNMCCSKGGRSQELALRFSVKMQELIQNEHCDDLLCMLMAAGTDGIDGPTDAAGAFGYSEQIYVAKKMNLIPQKFIEESNSYGYFSNIQDDIIKIGHTGTNVMDLHIILIQNLKNIGYLRK